MNIVPLPLRHMAEIVRRSFDSFPCVYAFTLLSAVVSLVSIWEPQYAKDLYQLNATLQWGVSVSFALYALDSSPRGKKLAPLLAIGAVAFVFLVQRNQVSSVAITRWVQLSLLSHLLISFAPYLRSGSEIGFWSYNKNLLFAFLVSTIYSVAILAGVMIALGGIQYLFDVQHRDFFKLYPSVAALCACVIHPAIFLGRVESKRIVKGSAEEGDLTPLRFFSTYVLFPLIFLYLAILLGYEGKIMYSMELPKGTVSWLVCSFGVIGVLTWLLTFPLGQKGKGAAGFFHKWFFYLFMPLLGLIAVGVWARVSAYGVTESRYFLVVLTAWISLVTVTFSLRPRTSIKVIPVSLFILALPTTFGPLSAFSTSYRSQLSRLEESLFKDGQCKEYPQDALSREERIHIHSVVNYLFDRHFSSMRAYLEERCKDDPKISSGIRTMKRGQYSSYREAWDLLAAFGVMDPYYAYHKRRLESHFTYHFYRDTSYGLNVDGVMEFFPNISVDGSPSPTREILVLRDKRTVTLSLEKSALKFTFSSGEVLVQDLSDRLATLEADAKDSQFADATLDFSIIDGDQTVKLFVTNLRGVKLETGHEIERLSGYVGFNVAKSRSQ